MRGPFATNAARNFLLGLGRFLVYEGRQLAPLDVQPFGALPAAVDPRFADEK